MSVTSSILRDIIRIYMELDSDQIWIRDQNVTIPRDSRLYVIVGMTDASVVAANMNIEDKPGGVTETSSTLMVENILIDVLSRDTTAITRRWEIITAMKSILGVQAQEENAIKIGRIPRSFSNTSQAEGGSRLNRFSINIPVHVCYSKERILDPASSQYYDDFNTRVDDQETIDDPSGLIEFNIKEEV